MGPQPKKKISRIRRGLRQATQTVKIANLVKCSECSAPKISHTVCPSCGKYNKLVVIKPKVETKVKRESK